MRQGLSSKEAAARLKEHGPNVLKGKKKNSAIKILLSQFKDFMVIILIICTIVSAMMGEMTEAIAIIAIVIMNALMGFIQEYKTEQTMNALKELAAPTAKVIRDGKDRTVHASEVVPGDIFHIEQGDRIPADGEIIEAHGLTVDEAMLTGESIAVEKSVSNKIFMGTLVRQGRAVCEVKHTGMKTEMGKIAGMIQEVEDESTPLQKKLSQLGKYIVIGCLVICAMVTVAGVYRGEDLLTMLISGISLAVAAVPEGLPAIVTIALALGVQRMLKRNALARRLPAIETLGCASVICSDKTGTLTENKMKVRRLHVIGNMAETDEESFCAKVEASAAMRLLTEISVLCSNSTIKDGDPTEVALLKMAQKAGIDFEILNGKNIRLDEIPFDSERKCMSVIIKKPNGEKYIYVKGAPDIVLSKCTRAYCSSGIKAFKYQKDLPKQILSVNEDMCKKALRVLAFAYRKIDESEFMTIPRPDFETDLTFIGLAGLIDPPRKEAFNAVKTCREAGIKTCMITGDHKDTAVAIAKELDIWREGDKVLTGKEIDALNPDEFNAAVRKTTVFARVMPQHKLKIVRSLKNSGHVVAMTGDGVNDAPAIKEADIGVAMGKGGTDVTREAADMILMDDNFATIVASISEGRVIFSNIRKFIRYLLSCNIGEVLTMFLAMVCGLPLPLMPIQVLWVNLATDGLPAIALGLEPAEKDIMKRKPRSSGEGIFSDGLLPLILIRGIVIGLSTLVVFSAIYYLNFDLTRARTAAFATLVFSQLVHVFECKSEKKSIFNMNLFNNMYLVGAVLCSVCMIMSVIYIPALQTIFRTTTLHGSDWLIIWGFSLLGPFGALFNKVAAKIVKGIKSLFKRNK